MIKVYLYCCLVLAVFVSCSEDVQMMDKIDFPSGTWSIDEPTRFDFEIEDTTSKYQLIYLVRNNKDYPYYNLYLTYFLEDDDGGLLDKKLQEIHLMDAKTGEPFGSGFGGVYDHKVLAIPDLKFESPGKYHFSVIHYMRTDSLFGILSFGIQINRIEAE